MTSGNQIGYGFVMVILSVSLLILAAVLYLLCRNKPEKHQQQHRQNEESQERISIKSSASAYPLTDIDTATDGFNQNRIVGQGRLGIVYAGIFLNGEIFAVKRIHPRHVLSNAGFGFSSVIKTLSFAQHQNIVPIVAFSQAPGERIIVNEFVGLMSLEFHLHQNPDGISLLGWNRRLKIAAEAARGLKYLHEDVTPSIVHGCVKTSKVLVDVKFCAKLCDYGLSFLAPKEKKGLVGYVDNEYWGSCSVGACKESDVYGFGVVLLEILCGRRSEEGSLVRWALPLIKEMRFSEILDTRIAMPLDMKPIWRLAKVASACVGNNRKSRPSIIQVSTILDCLEIEASL